MRYTVKPLILAALNFDRSSYEIIVAPLMLASSLTELLVIQYAKLPFNICDPLFSRICRSREIHEIKGMRKFRVLQYF